jgi:ribonuclease D
VRVLGTREELTAGLRELEGAPRYYLDTEFESSKRGKRLSLIQISRGEEIFLVDALRIGQLLPTQRGSLRDLGAVVCRADAEWVLHAGLQDVELLLEVFEAKSAPALFDTQLVWGMLGPEASVSLAFLVFRVLGIRSSKGYQADDWMRRPLPRAQLEYAAQDIAHLPAIERELRSRAQKLEREPLINEICREALLPAPAQPLALTFESFRNAWQLDSIGQAALRALCDWFNALPSEHATLQPKTLLSIASRMPQTADELSRIKGVSTQVSRQHTAELLALLARARNTAPEAGSMEPVDYASFEDFVREARLLLARAEVCQELSIAPDLALPMAVVRRMQQRAHATGELGSAALELTGWREALLAPSFSRHLLGRR